MAQSLRAPQQHKQPSRKGKRAWRKNVDITEVQEGLEALREEVIQGGPVAEKESKDLFILDTAGSEDIRKTYKLQKPLRADEILAKRSAVAAVDVRKRPGSKVTDGILPASKKQKLDWVSKKEVQRLRKVAQQTSHLTTTRLDEEESTGFDLWMAGDDSKIPSAQELEYLPKRKEKVAPTTLQRAPVALTASGKAVKAIRNPESGTSYNPAFEEWNQILAKEGQKEVEAEKARRIRAENDAEKAAKVAAIMAKEPEEQVDEESAWEGFESEREELALKRKRPERKNQAQRNKIKRRKEVERLAKHIGKMSDKRKQAMELEAPIKAAKNQNRDVALTFPEESSESDSVDDRVLRRRALGNTLIPEKPLELVLPDELQDSLRRLRPEGNLLNDRFRHLLVNGKIESRKPIAQGKKKRRTFTEKWTYKDFSVQV